MFNLPKKQLAILIFYADDTGIYACLSQKQEWRGRTNGGTYVGPFTDTHFKVAKYNTVGSDSQIDYYTYQATNINLNSFYYGVR